MRAIAVVVGVISAVLFASSCGGSTRPPTTSAPISLGSPRVHQIALARASNRLFAIFPAQPGEKRCGIPEGGVHFRPLPGTCTTSIHAAATHEPALLVTFTEKWQFPPCPRGEYCAFSRTAHHTWQVIEGEPIVTATARLRIVATRQSGATAPQYYK